MGITKLSIMILLARLSSKGGNHYVKPAPAKILQLLEKYQKIKISRRWLFQCLRDLENAGYIKRKQRYDTRQVETWKQLSSMISFTLEGAEFLACRSIQGASDIKKRILAWLNQKNDKRWPKAKETAHQEPPRQNTDPFSIDSIISNLVNSSGTS